MSSWISQRCLSFRYFPTVGIATTVTHVAHEVHEKSTGTVKPLVGFIEKGSERRYHPLDLYRTLFHDKLRPDSSKLPTSYLLYGLVGFLETAESAVVRHLFGFETRLGIGCDQLTHLSFWLPSDPEDATLVQSAVEMIKSSGLSWMASNIGELIEYERQPPLSLRAVPRSIKIHDTSLIPGKAGASLAPPQPEPPNVRLVREIRELLLKVWNPADNKTDSSVLLNRNKFYIYAALFFVETRLGRIEEAERLQILTAWFLKDWYESKDPALGSFMWPSLLEATRAFVEWDPEEHAAEILPSHIIQEIETFTGAEDWTTAPLTNEFQHSLSKFNPTEVAMTLALIVRCVEAAGHLEDLK